MRISRPPAELGLSPSSCANRSPAAREQPWLKLDLAENRSLLRANSSWEPGIAPAETTSSLQTFHHLAPRAPLPGHAAGRAAGGKCHVPASFQPWLLGGSWHSRSFSWAARAAQQVAQHAPKTGSQQAAQRVPSPWLVLLSSCAEGLDCQTLPGAAAIL